jgi:hypothetical protein
MCILAFPAYAATSTINTTLPVANSTLSSSVIRQQFIAAYNDINALYSHVYCKAPMYLTTPDGAVVTGTYITAFTLRRAFVVTNVYAHLTVGPTTTAVIVDVKAAGASILGTQIHVDTSTIDSVLSASPATITTATLAANTVVSFDVVQADSGLTASGLEVDICGYDP